MKKFEAMKKISLSWLLILLTLATLVSLLSGCAARSTSTPSVSLSDIAFDESANSLTKEELKTLAEFLVGNSETYVAFVAAYRGYDMTEKDFDLEADRPKLDPSVDAAKNVLKKYDKDGKKLSSVDYSELTVADMESVIDVLKTDIEKESRRNFFETIQYWIGLALAAVTKAFGGNYLVGICIFAILFELLLIPLSIKQQKNSIKQASLRPKEMAIRRKYAGRNDQPTQQKIQAEIQELYQRENFNPMGGCLPMLFQLPIILILYNIVIDPIRYTLGLSAQFSSTLTSFYTTAKAAGGLGGVAAAQQRGTIEILSRIKDQGIEVFEGLGNFLFIENGSECYSWLVEIGDKIPSFSLGSLNFGLTPNFNTFNWLWLLPLITFAVYFGSMKLTRKLTYQPTANDAQTGCSNNIMDITMPLMSVYISFIVPATISVYWIFKSILGTLKQLVLSRTMPLPKCTEEDIKAAERELKGKKPHTPAKTAATENNGTKPRSLHHIDDDDELPPPSPKKKDSPKEKPEDQAAEQTPSQKEETPDTPMEKAPLKDDSDKPSKND